MQTTYSAFNAKTHFSKLLGLAEKGNEIIITKHGVPVAKLVPAVQRDQAKINAAVEKLMHFAEGGKPLGMSLRALREEGRR